MAFAIDKLLLIPDGHRRYAEQHALPLTTAYELGGQTASRIVERALGESMARVLTLYPLAKKNFSERSQSSLQAICKALDTFLTRITPLTEEGMAVRYRGSLRRLPRQTRAQVEQLAMHGSVLRDHRMVLELLIDYSGAEEIQNIPRKDFRSLLDDSFTIVVRTGGHFRLSDAPPLECLGAEFVALPMMFPELEYEHLHQVIDSVRGEKKRREVLRQMEMRHRAPADAHGDKA